jgi:hypothetical protein
MTGSYVIIKLRAALVKKYLIILISSAFFVGELSTNDQLFHQANEEQPTVLYHFMKVICYDDNCSIIILIVIRLDTIYNYRIINFIYVVYSVFSDLHEYNTPMCQFFFAIFEFLHLKAVFYNDDTFCLEHIIEVLLTFAWNRLKKNFNTIIPVSYGLEPDIAIVLAKKCISSSVKNNIISPWNKPRYVTKSLLLIF